MKRTAHPRRQLRISVVLPKQRTLRLLTPASGIAGKPKEAAVLRAHTPTHRLPSTLAVLVALLAVAGAVSGPAPAAFPGANGKLAFVRAGDIWVVDADGSNPTQLTSDPAEERSPAFSPDGTEIAFARRNGDFEIFVMAARAGDIARQLTSNEGEQDRFPSWTADGSQIVYDKDFAAIYAVPADGAGGEPISRSRRRSSPSSAQLKIPADSSSSSRVSAGFSRT
jgi:WD40-like Beta Propeller Repeat